MSERVLGRATVRVDGKPLLVAAAAKLNLGGVQRNTVKGTEVHGFAEEPMEAFVEVEATIKKGQSAKEWGEVENATVMFEADTGQVWTLRNAWQANAVELTAGEGGRVPLRFVSKHCEELVSG